MMENITNQFCMNCQILLILSKEMTSGSSTECNKEKDSSNTIGGTRISAGMDFCKDKVEQAGHAVAKEINKQKAMR
ncbi:unnamed protein product [Rotaria magnacalcarata]|uniref:Uncharacterized protein n=1 Tax=Rotaria magnacalcarata TaxID=392030 RepID=A0A8S2MKG0_9BILA|nr:unnamed protein product [Rotaria magnacalcarata]